MEFPLYFPITFDEVTEERGGTYSLIVDGENFGEVYEPYIEIELNQIWFAEFEVYNLTSEQLSSLTKNSNAVILHGNTPFLYGVMRSVTKDEDGAAYVVRVESPAALLTDKINYDSSSTDGRKEWTNERGDVIIKQLLAGRMGEGQIDQLPYIGFRAEYDTPLEAISGVCKICGKDWWISRDPISGNLFNVSEKGSSAPSQTFTMGGNIDRTEAEDTNNSVYNKIYCFGYGDGRNQLRSVWEHSTVGRAVLTEDISDTALVVPVTQTRGINFGTHVWIGREKCAVLGTAFSPPSIELSARGVNSNDINPYPHKAGIEVYNAQYTADNPQAGSSIAATNGPIENRYVDRSIVDQNTLDFLAQRLGHKYKDESVQGKFVCYADATTASIGDIVTIVDYDGNQSNYRVIKWRLDPEEFAIIIDYSTIGSEPLTTIELSRNIDINNPYGQGSTCINQIQSYENCSSAYPLHVRFRIPDDVVAINKVLLSFRIEDYRTYHKETTGHAHNVSIPIVHKDDGNLGSNNVYITGTFNLIDTQRFINGRTGLGAVFSESYASSSNSATTYTIDTVNVASPSVAVYAGENGSETLVGTYTDDQDEINLITKIPESGRWYNVKFVPAEGQHLRIEANVYMKVFIRSN